MVRELAVAVLVEHRDHDVDDRIGELDIRHFARHFLQQFACKRLAGEFVEVQCEIDLE